MKCPIVGNMECPYESECEARTIEALYGSEYDVPIERAFGDWSPGRYGWIVERAVRYPEPIFAPGAQGIWKWNPRKE